MKELIQNGQAKAGKFWRNFKTFLWNVFLFFRTGAKNIICFTVFWTFVSVIGGWYYKKILFALFTRLSGLSFVNLGNLMQAVKSPATYIMIFLYLILATILSLFELGGLLHAYSMAQVGRETDFVNMMAAGWRTCRRTLHPKNWGIIVFLIILLPLTGILPLSGVGYKAALPYFVQQAIDSDTQFRTLGSIAYTTLLAVELIYLFAIDVYIIEGLPFLAALRKSRRLGRGHVLNTLLSLVLFTLLVNFLINSVSSIIPVNIAELIAVFDHQSVTIKKQIIGSYVYALRQALRSIIGPALNTAALTVLFYRYLDDKDELAAVDPSIFRLLAPNPRKLKYGRILTAVLLVSMTAGYFWHYRYLRDPVKVPEVCAHRGDNIHAPENTLPAFELAFSEQIPWVETDVMMTNDGILVCSHDSNLKRVTGSNVSVGRSTYEYLQEYEMGKWMPGVNIYGRITVPTLEEVLYLTKQEGGKIQIELKPLPTDQNFEEEVVRLIQEYDMKDSCLVISLYTEPLRRIHELDPSIRTAYCAYAAWPGYRNVPDQDGLSIADNSVNPDLVQAMHSAGIEVFCWTVDSMDDVQYLVSCGVDEIGTNDPLAITEALSVADYKGGLNRLFHIFLHEIASMGQE